MTAEQKTTQPAQQDSALAITSMILGTLSLTGFGFILGIPAIICAAIALKRKAGNRDLSIAGLITGIISTVISLLFVAFMLIVFFWATSLPHGVFEDHMRQYDTPQVEHSQT